MKAAGSGVISCDANEPVCTSIHPLNVSGVVVAIDSVVVTLGSPVTIGVVVVGRTVVVLTVGSPVTNVVVVGTAVVVVVQFSSSRPSEQSIRPSHTHFCGMHSSSQANSAGQCLSVSENLGGFSFNW